MKLWFNSISIKSDFKKYSDFSWIRHALCSGDIILRYYPEPSALICTPGRWSTIWPRLLFGWSARVVHCIARTQPRTSSGDCCKYSRTSQDGHPSGNAKLAVLQRWPSCGGIIFGGDFFLKFRLFFYHFWSVLSMYWSEKIKVPYFR